METEDDIRLTSPIFIGNQYLLTNGNDLANNHSVNNNHDGGPEGFENQWSSPDQENLLIKTPEKTSKQHNKINAQVLLSHKPRGGKGVWQNIEDGTALRVTRGKGKWLNLEVRSDSEIHSGDVQFFLVDSQDPKTTDPTNKEYREKTEGFTLIKTHEYVDKKDWVMNFELKLDRVGKRLTFEVQIKNVNGNFRGFTSYFSSHNNGKVRNISPSDANIGKPQNTTGNPAKRSKKSTKNEGHVPEEPVGLHYLTNFSSSSPEYESGGSDGNNGNYVPQPGAGSNPLNLNTNSTNIHPSLLSDPAQLHSVLPTNGFTNDPNSGFRTPYALGGFSTPQPNNQQQLDANNSHPHSSSSSSTPPESLTHQEIPLPGLHYHSVQTPLLSHINSGLNLSNNSSIRNSGNQNVNAFPFSPVIYDPLLNPKFDPNAPNITSQNNNNYTHNHNAAISSHINVNMNNSVNNGHMNRMSSPNYLLPLNNNANNNFESNPSNKLEPSNSNGQHQIEIPGNLKVTGEVKARAFISYSDIRLKANVEDIVDALEIVKKLDGKSYTWKSRGEEEAEGRPGRKVLGFIAQEVQKVLPDVVYEDESGNLCIAYIEIVPILLEAIKEYVHKAEQESGRMDQKIQDIERKVVELDEFVKCKVPPCPPIPPNKKKQNTKYYFPNIRNVFRFNYTRKNVFTFVTFILAFIGIIGVATILGVLLHPSLNTNNNTSRALRATYFYDNAQCTGAPLEIVARPFVILIDNTGAFADDTCADPPVCVRSLDRYPFYEKTLGCMNESSLRTEFALYGTQEVYKDNSCGEVVSLSWYLLATCFPGTVEVQSGQATAAKFLCDSGLDSFSYLTCDVSCSACNVSSVRQLDSCQALLDPSLGFGTYGCPF